MAGKYGIENLSISIVWAVTLAKELEECLKDKKIRTFELFGLIDNVKQFSDIAANFSEVKKEFEDLDAAEITELHDIIAYKLNYDNKKIIIVTHGGPIRMFLFELLNLKQQHLFQFRIDPGSMTVIGKYQYSTQLILLNSTTPPKGIVPNGCV